MEADILPEDLLHETLNERQVPAVVRLGKAIWSNNSVELGLRSFLHIRIVYDSEDEGGEGVECLSGKVSRVLH